MTATKLNRRQFLGLGLATAAVFAGTRATEQLLDRAQPKSPKLYSASDNELGEHFLSQLDLDTRQLQQVKIPMRGHAVLALPHQQALVFGRRPCFLSVHVDMATQAITLIQPTLNRHFNGHGCLSVDKQVLFTSETDYAARRGIIGVRDCSSFKLLAEYPSYGLDPHDLQLMPDGKTLVVANGGIETHPDFGRRKLNLATLQPSLVYLDSETGKKLAEYRLADRYLGIRHLTVTAKGDVALALQYEGDLHENQPQSLVAWQANGQSLQLLEAPAGDLAKLQGYLADIIYLPTAQRLISASPRGSQLSIWNTRTSNLEAIFALPEVSGVAYWENAQQVLVSSSLGELYQLASASTLVEPQTFQSFSSIVWDNHLTLAYS